MARKSNARYLSHECVVLSATITPLASRTIGLSIWMQYRISLRGSWYLVVSLIFAAFCNQRFLYYFCYTEWHINYIRLLLKVINAQRQSGFSGSLCSCQTIKHTEGKTQDVDTLIRYVQVISKASPSLNHLHWCRQNIAQNTAKTFKIRLINLFGKYCRGLSEIFSFLTN